MKKKTYFASWIGQDEKGIQIGNATILTDKRGQELVRYIISEVTTNYPNATILSISKVG